MDDFEQKVRESIRASVAAKERLLGDTFLISAIAKVGEVLIDAFRKGNKLLVFGNGGRAADAQHIVAELVGRFASDRPPLPALALSENSSSMTAISNDYGFDHVFSRQIEALGRARDVALAITTSGNSPNVLQAVFTARKMGCTRSD